MPDPIIPTTEETTETTEQTTEETSSAITGAAAKESSEETTSTVSLPGDDFTNDMLVALKDADGAALIPEGMELNAEASESFTKLINSADSKESLAKGLLPLYTSELKRVQEEAGAELAETYNNLQTDRVEEIKNSPVYGGANMQKSLGEAKRIVEFFGGKEALELLDSTGFGNSLAAVTLFNKIAAVLPGEPTPVEGNPDLKRPDQASRMGFGV